MRNLSLVSSTPPNRRGADREWTFEATVNGCSRYVTVAAPDEFSAIEKVVPYVDQEAEQLAQLGVVSGTGVLLLTVGLLGVGAVYVVRRAKEIASGQKPYSTRPATPGAKKPVSNGSEIEAPAETTTTTTARTTFTTRGWRRLRYNGQLGLIAGEDPTLAMRVIVYSDTNVDRFLALVRPSYYDMQLGELRDAIVVMSFPAASAGRVRANGALEVFLGENAPSGRIFDVVAANPETAIAEIQDILSSSLR